MDLVESLAHLEQSLGLPDGFCFKLQLEDDWSFVVKLHALIECAVAEQITHAFDRKELADIFSRIELSNNRTGKVAFVKSLGLLPAQHIQFIRSLSELRNELAHNVHNITVNLTEFFTKKTVSCSQKQLREFADRWAFGIRINGQKYPDDALARFYLPVDGKVTITGTDIPADVVFDRARFLLVWPKLAIWWTALAVLDAISLCNRFGPQFWNFDQYDSDDKAAFLASAHNLFDKAKVGDPAYVEKQVYEIEHMNPGLRVKRDEDGQPNVESLAACLAVDKIRQFASED